MKHIDNIGFYNVYKKDFNKEDFEGSDKVSYDYKLFKTHYEDSGKFCKYLDEHKKFDVINESFREKLIYREIHFEPRHFYPEIALECDLLPFTYKSKNFLTFGGTGMMGGLPLAPRLDAYQVLSSGTIDKDSEFLLSPAYQSAYETTLGMRIVGEMRKILGIEQQGVTK